MDIVKRLKKLIGVHIGDADIDDRLEDAIAEIERLRDALKKIGEIANNYDNYGLALEEISETSRAALKRDE